jgi:hypothetical protein
MIQLAQLFNDLEASVIQQEPAVARIEEQGEQVNTEVAKAVCYANFPTRMNTDSDRTWNSMEQLSRQELLGGRSGGVLSSFVSTSPRIACGSSWLTRPVLILIVIGVGVGVGVSVANK